MEYHKEITLRDSRTCLLRSGTEADGQAVLDNFNATHAETDFLLTYPDENSFTPEQESAFLREKAGSADEAEILAIVDGKVVGTAGIESLGHRDKVRHRTELGISVSKSCWGLGIGRALMEACLECAVQAGYRQAELTVAADNTRAVSLYESLGFTEYGRNPRGFCSRTAGWQTLILMRKEL